MGSRAPVRRAFGQLLAETRGFRPAPFLKWAGGKGQLLDQMQPFFPKQFGTYFEPFLGGGAVFFRLLPERAVLSDLNSELVLVFEVVRDDPGGLMKALDRHHPHRRDRKYFYRVRDEIDPVQLPIIERAARTVFLNKTCYNGLYRVNSKGRFNVPFGKYHNPSLYNRDAILSASAVLKGKMIVSVDYLQACEYARDGDFVYLDPPYHPLSATANFTGYTRDSFGIADQKELSIAFTELDRRGCKVMLSNSATDHVSSLYDGYRTEVVKATRAINSRPSGRGEVSELLVMNY